MVRFSSSAYRTALFPVQSNPEWQPAANLENYSGIAQFPCDSTAFLFLPWFDVNRMTKVCPKRFLNFVPSDIDLWLQTSNCSLLTIVSPELEVDDDLLLQRLHLGVVLEWIRSFLQGRTRVLYNGQASNSCHSAFHKVPFQNWVRWLLSMACVSINMFMTVRAISVPRLMRKHWLFTDLRHVSRPLMTGCRLVGWNWIQRKQRFCGVTATHCVSENTIRRVLSVQNAAARLLTGAGRRDHISPVLRQLHWLPVQRRVDYKLACFVFSSLSGHAPPYLADDIHLVSEGPRRRLRSSTDRSCAVHAHTTHSATGASRSPGHVFGTVFRPTCAMRTLQWLHTADSGVNSKRFVLMLLPWRNETFVNWRV